MLKCVTNGELHDDNMILIMFYVGRVCHKEWFPLRGYSEAGARYFKETGHSVFGHVTLDI